MSVIPSSPAGFHRALGCLLLASGLFLNSGCSSGSKSGSVSGKVSCVGKPVTAGEVHFYMKERGQGAIARIDQAGNYTFDTPLEVGTYAVYVTPPHPEPGAPAPARQGVLDIPRKYHEPDTSGLSFTVASGSNDFSVEMSY